ncbi:GNAT family N-acetyltransferase [Lederbergia citrea]|uniref:GNAT family N-acetyltransferase n=1 Tax=Lederbergia citrea TaxID=2833581 RepID=UPI001BCA0074|nr:GNAT family N-acetyltransferase [Lederbergia citrea]MBS4179023.1 GNAT family N-acetyltransferase [Lederbergia citrea]MBS4205680.1 GNAT family N-acetyltransferase [Lederbergia citrea]
MNHSIQIRQMKSEDIEVVYEVFTEHGINKPKEYVHTYWEENEKGDRITLLAFYNGQFAGSLHFLKKSSYPYFSENNIPEINDFNVIEPLKRLGIGNRLMDAAEQIAKEQYGIVGIGVGMHFYYGPAQRIYAKRGYIPDGKGVTYHHQEVMPGTMVYADDDLVLYMTKNLK